jgi:hypothetical protein
MSRARKKLVHAKRPRPRCEAQLEKRERLAELIAVVILSIAALLSSYSTFQSDLWDGEQASYYTRSEQMRTAASKSQTVAIQYESVDVALFAQWTNAFAHGEDVLDRFYRDRFRPAFRESFDRWIAMKPMTNPDAPRTPFAMPGYDREAKLEAQNGEANADKLYRAGEHANNVSDAFGQANVLLAVALFLAGITQAFSLFKLRVGLLGVAGFCAS